ncbi:hypothetical protein WKI68_42185 [Streptomyces sp. MS1.HAVA.3]|uniref:Uncharacterized protein n=1 Tax=Streptomyces caledonius TaxID=3134107 RepID=A0ABU8UEW2_9ACTN
MPAQWAATWSRPPGSRTPRTPKGIGALTEPEPTEHRCPPRARPTAQQRRKPPARPGQGTPPPRPTPSTCHEDKPILSGRSALLILFALVTAGTLGALTYAKTNGIPDAAIAALVGSLPVLNKLTGD